MCIRDRVFVGAAATIFLFHGGDAVKGAAVYLGAHVLSATLFFGFLKKRGNAPAGMIPAYAIGVACIIALGVLSLLGTSAPAPAQFTTTALMFCIWAAVVTVLFRIGMRRRWLPSREILLRLATKLHAMLRPA